MESSSASAVQIEPACLCMANRSSQRPSLSRRRLTDAGQPSVEHVRGMFAAMQGPAGAGAAGGHLSDDEDVSEYGPKQPDSKVQHSKTP